MTEPSENITLGIDGIFRVNGEEITHARTHELFLRSIVQRGSRFFLCIGREEKEVAVADTAFFIRGVSEEKDHWCLELTDGTRELLHPQSLEWGLDDVLRCELRNRGRARFLRQAQIAFLQKTLREEKGRYGILLQGRFWPLTPAVEKRSAT